MGAFDDFLKNQGGGGFGSFTDFASRHAGIDLSGYDRSEEEDRKRREQEAAQRQRQEQLSKYAAGVETMSDSGKALVYNRLGNTARDQSKSEEQRRDAQEKLEALKYLRGEIAKQEPPKDDRNFINKYVTSIPSALSQQYRAFSEQAASILPGAQTEAEVLTKMVERGEISQEAYDQRITGALKTANISPTDSALKTYAKSSAGFGEALFDAATLGTAKAATQGAKQVIRRGALEGAGSGFLGSVRQTGDLSTALPSTILGATIGGGLAGGGKFFSKTDDAANTGAKIATSDAAESLRKMGDVPEETIELVRETFKRKEAVGKRTGAQTSRTKQFSDTKTVYPTLDGGKFLGLAEREIIDTAEAAEAGFVRSGQVQSQAETIAAAVKRGPIDLENVRVGDKIDAPDVARARFSIDPYITAYGQAVADGNADAIQKTFSQLQKAREGYQIITSEPGRALDIQKTFDNKLLKVMDAVQDYHKTIADGKGLTKGQTQELNRLIREVAEDATQGADQKIKAGAITAVRALEEYATAAKLTSPITHFRNLIGNTSTFLLRAAEQGGAIGVGAVRGGTDIRALKHVFGTSVGYKTATKNMLEVLRDAVLLRDATSASARAAQEGFRNVIPGKAGNFVRLPFRLLEASDEFGKTVLRSSRIAQEAWEIGTREGFKGKALTNRVAELIENPTAAMKKAAEKDALEYTFQAPLGKAGEAAQTLQGVPGAKFFIPFIKTPTNIVKFQAKRSIAGAPFQLGEAIAKRGTREGDEALARTVLGAGLSLGVYQYVANNSDMITGAPPTNDAEKDAFYAEGKQPYSIKIGGRWVPYGSIQPLGLYILQAQSLQQAIEENDEAGAAEIAGAMVSVAAKGLLDLPFVAGMNNAIEAINDPEYAAENFLTNVARGFVPNGLRDIRLYMDDVVRSPEGIIEGMMDMVPGLSDDLDARMGVLGEPITRGGSPLERSLFRISGTQGLPEDQMPETLRVIRQLDEGSKVSDLSRGLTVSNYTTKTGAEIDRQAFREFQIEYGKALDQLIKSNSGRILGLSGEEQNEFLSKLNAQARQSARERVGFRSKE